jgi:hypothetical protein
MVPGLGIPLSTQGPERGTGTQKPELGWGTRMAVRVLLWQWEVRQGPAQQPVSRATAERDESGPQPLTDTFRFRPRPRPPPSSLAV